MSIKYKFHDPDTCYFVTFAVVYWVDFYKKCFVEKTEDWTYSSAAHYYCGIPPGRGKY